MSGFLVMTEYVEFLREDVARLTRVLEVAREDAEYFENQLKVCQSRVESATVELLAAKVNLADAVVSLPVGGLTNPQINAEVVVVQAVNYDNVPVDEISVGDRGIITHVYSDGDVDVLFSNGLTIPMSTMSILRA